MATILESIVLESDLGISCIGSIWKNVRNADSQTPSQTYWVKICILTRYSDNSHARWSLRSSGLDREKYEKQSGVKSAEESFKVLPSLEQCEKWKLRVYGQLFLRNLIKPFWSEYLFLNLQNETNPTHLVGLTDVSIRESDKTIYMMSSFQTWKFYIILLLMH